MYCSPCDLLGSIFSLGQRVNLNQACTWVHLPYCSHVSADNHSYKIHCKPTHSSCFQPQIQAPFAGMKCGLTEEVAVLLDCDSKSVACLLNPEEDHCHVLWWSDAPLNIPTFTEVYISLRSGERMVQWTGKFLSLEYPSIKHLQRFNNIEQGFAYCFLSTEEKHEV